jgi:outer membrane protein TolC
MTEQAKAQLDDMLRAHVAEVRAMIQEWENGRERLGRFERELIPISKERSRATLTAYQGGKASLSDVLVARRNETEARLQSLQLEMDTARLWAQLNFLYPENASSMHDHASTSGSLPKGAQ